MGVSALDEAFALDDCYLPAVARGWQDTDWEPLNVRKGEETK